MTYQYHHWLMTMVLQFLLLDRVVVVLLMVYFHLHEVEVLLHHNLLYHLNVIHSKSLGFFFNGLSLLVKSEHISSSAFLFGLNINFSAYSSLTYGRSLSISYLFATLLFCLLRT
jgi:hypothetical protein